MNEIEQHDISDDYPNTYGRSEVTCPYCGDEWRDSWERSDDDGIEYCDSCKKKFKWVREVSVSYESKPVEQSEL